MADVDTDDVTIEVEQGDMENPENLGNSNPNAFLYDYITLASQALATYGWFIIAALVAVLLFRKQIFRFLAGLRESSSTVQHKKFDASEVEKRETAKEERMRKLQEEYDQKAAMHAEKRAEIEAQKRKEKLEDWERHQSGLGYRSKGKKLDDPPEQPPTTLPKKKRLRDEEFSPLTGSDGPSCSWRPGRRGPAAGGG